MDLNGFQVGLAIIFACLCARVTALHCCAGHNRTSSLLGVEIRACSRSEADSGIHVHLACPPKHQLVDIEVNVGRSLDKCVGKTTDLIAAVNECYWKQSCDVPFPRKQMITCTPTIQLSSKENCPCFLEKPDMILVTRAKCAKSKYVKDLKCRKRDRRRKKKRRNITKRAAKRRRNGKGVKVGIIRSHQEFPWFYKKANETNLCSFNIKHKRKDVVIETLVNDICEFDGLTIVRHDSKVIKKQEIYDNNVTVINSTDNGKVTIYFMRKSDSGCGGFIICYKVTKPIGRQDVCEELMEMNAAMRITSYAGTLQQKEYTEQCTDDVTDTCCGETSCGDSSTCNLH